MHDLSNVEIYEIVLFKQRVPTPLDVLYSIT